MRKRHRTLTVTIPQKDNERKATSSLSLPHQMIAKLERILWKVSSQRNNLIKLTPYDEIKKRAHNSQIGLKQTPSLASMGPAKTSTRHQPTDESKYVMALIESDAWPTILQLKRKPYLQTVIGFTTRHADRRMISMLCHNFFITFGYLFELITKIRLSFNSFEFIN